MKKVIPIGMISDNNFIMPTSVAIVSMIKNKNIDTIYEIYVLMAECSEESKSKISQLDNMSEDCNIHLIEVGLDKYRDFKQLAHISIACLLKFDLCDLIPGYDKILYLDGDIIVRKDLWELYDTDLEGKYAGAVKEIQCIDTKRSNINAGIMLFNAKRIRDEKLSQKLFEARKSLGDRASMDQQTFNIVTECDYLFLPIKYNCILGCLIEKEGGKNYNISDINDIYHEKYKNKKQIIEDAVIYHFASGNKPWKYTLNTGAKEWYVYYQESPCFDSSFKLYGKWGYRIDKMETAWREKGLKGVLERVGDKTKRVLKIRKKNDSWE